MWYSVWDEIQLQMCAAFYKQIKAYVSVRRSANVEGKFPSNRPGGAVFDQIVASMKKDNWHAGQNYILLPV